MQDTQLLLRRPLISSEDDNETTAALLALSDMHATFSASRRRECKAAARKIAFYAAIVNAKAFTTADLNQVAKELSQAQPQLHSTSETTHRHELLMQESIGARNEALLPAMGKNEDQKLKIQVLS